MWIIDFWIDCDSNCENINNEEFFTGNNETLVLCKEKSVRMLNIDNIGNGHRKEKARGEHILAIFKTIAKE